MTRKLCMLKTDIKRFGNIKIIHLSEILYLKLCDAGTKKHLNGVSFVLYNRTAIETKFIYSLLSILLEPSGGLLALTSGGSSLGQGALSVVRLS